MILNALLAAEVKPELAAVSTYPVPNLSILRPLKVATPLTALTVAVPDKVPPPGLVVIVSETEAEEVVTVLPPASATVTTG